MSELFLKIVNMSIAASWLILAVLVLRLVLRKAPRWVHVLLWGLVAMRLICPFSFESALSLIPSAETIRPTILMDRTPSVQTGIPALDRAVNPIISGSLAPAPEASANPLQIWTSILSIVWVVGIGALLLYATVSYLRLRRRVSEAVMLRDNIYQSEAVGSPFVLGLVKPKIYLPFTLGSPDLEHVVAHERAHICRKDHWWKPLGFLLLTIYWFNPLMWLAYVLLCRDIEFACDEKVIRELGHEQRADYTQALVSCGVNRRGLAACPLAFGEVGVKERVKSVLNYKKPTFWIVAVAVILCGAAAVCFLTDPIPSPAGTYESDGSGGAILDCLGASEDDAALVADALETPNASLRLDGTEITVTQVLRDDRYAYLAYEIELPEDFPEDGQPPWLATGFYLTSPGDGGKIPCLTFCPVSTKRSGHMVRVVAEAHLGDAATGDAWDAVLVLTRPEDATGADFRELRWSLAQSPLTRTLEPNAKVRDDGTVLTRLTVSPLSVRATLEGSKSITGLTVNVFFRDGTMFDATKARVSSYNNLDFSEPDASVVHGGEVGYPFGQIVDVSTIERIVVGEAEVLF